MGILTDKELYYLEDGLNLLIKDTDKVLIQSQKQKAKDIIIKLYSDFWEAPKGQKKPDTLITNYR